MKKLIALIILASVLALTITSCGVYDHDHTPTHYTEYTVQSGDTLWAIATKSNGYGELDRRCIIDDIKSKSGCTSDLRVGQTIYIPDYDI